MSWTGKIVKLKHNMLQDEDETQHGVKMEHNIFEPDSPTRLVWDLIKSIFLLYYLIMIPLRIGFVENGEHFIEISPEQWICTDFVMLSVLL